MTKETLAIRTTGLEADGAAPAPGMEIVEGTVVELGPSSGPLEKGAALPARFEVLLGARSVEAKRAASCLLLPMGGDRVVVAISANEAFVLGVLERPGAAPSTVELGGGVTLETDAQQTVRVRGARELDLSASQAVTATAEEVRVRAGRASLFAKKVEAVGLSLESSFDQVRQLGRIVEIVADEVSSKLKRSLRFISEIDQTRARVVDTRAEGVVMIHGENTCVTARQIAKIDSNQIHIG